MRNSTAGRLDTRAIFAEARARFNADHPWPELLDQYGGTEIRPGYWACNCGVAHTHDIQIAITSQGKIISLSNRCGWARPDRALDQFGFYCDRAHASNYLSAIEAAARQYDLWVEPRAETARESAPAAHYSDAQRTAYNAARRDRRHAETRNALDAIYDQACTLNMPDRAHWLFAYLHTRCSERGILQIAPTNAQLSKELDMCARYVQYAFRALEAAGLGKRQGGRNIAKNEAATWTFYKTPHLGCKAHQDAECTLSYNDHDLVPESGDLVSAAPVEPAAGEQAALVEQLSAMDDAAFAAWYANHAPRAGEQVKNLTKPDMAPAPCPDSAETAHASYTPVELPRHAPYTGRSKHVLDTEARYALVWSSMRPLDMAEPSDQPELLDLDQPRARRMARPAQPAAVDRYLVELASMAESELAGELKKHRATLKKHSGAPWLRSIRDRLFLVEQEIDARAESTRPNERGRSQAHAAPRVHQAALYGL